MLHNRCIIEHVQVETSYSKNHNGKSDNRHFKRRIRFGLVKVFAGSVSSKIDGDESGFGSNKYPSLVF